MVDNPLLILAEHAASWRTRPMPEQVAHHARRALIDWFAALLPGLSKPPATLLAAAMPRCSTRRPATPSSSTTSSAMPAITPVAQR